MFVDKHDTCIRVILIRSHPVIASYYQCVYAGLRCHAISHVRMMAHVLIAAYVGAIGWREMSA